MISNLQKEKSRLKYALLTALLLVVPFILNKGFDWNYGILISCFICLYTIAVSGLDLLFGYTGQISMGHAAFFAIGAYGSVMLHKYAGIPVFFTIIIGATLAMLIGSVIAYPASKLVFHFLSLATIAFGEIVYQLTLQSPNKITGNATGFFTETVSFFGFKLNTYTRFYYFVLICTVLFLVGKRNLVGSRVGRAMLAIRENSHAADGMGINVRKYKVIAFAVSAFYTAFAGGLYAHFVRYISPDTFSRKQSIMFLTMLLFGGTASIKGPILGVVSVLLFNEFLRVAEKYQMMIYGVLLLIVIVAMPGGIYNMIKDVVKKIEGGRKNAAS